MKKLLLILTTLIPLAAAVVAVLLFSQPEREMTAAEEESDTEAENQVAEIRAAIERGDFEKIRPLVRATRRIVAKDLFMDGTSPAWADAIHAAFGDIKVRDASKLRAACIDALVEGTKATGQEWRGLRLFLSKGFPRWERGESRGSKTRYATLPCLAELVRYEDRIGWLVVANWEYESWPDTTIGHIALFVVDPKSGELRAFTQCG